MFPLRPAQRSQAGPKQSEIQREKKYCLMEVVRGKPASLHLCLHGRAPGVKRVPGWEQGRAGEEEPAWKGVQQSPGSPGGRSPARSQLHRSSKLLGFQQDRCHSKPRLAIPRERCEETQAPAPPEKCLTSAFWARGDPRVTSKSTPPWPLRQQAAR